MVLTDVTAILKVLLATFGAVAAPDELTRRRIGQIGQVIGAAEDIGRTENKPGDPTVLDRVTEAHDILSRVAAILAAEPQPAPAPAPTDGLVPIEYGWNGKHAEGTIILGEDATVEEEGFLH